MRLFVIGNSHVWSLLGWDRFAGHYDSLRMDASVAGLDLVGIAVTGATAHNLIEEGSTTGGGAKSHALLDSDPDPSKSVLAVFGDVDLRTHVRDSGMLGSTLDRYLGFLQSVAARPDVTRVLASSITGHHGSFGADAWPLIREWNALLESECLRRGWTYVDLLTPGAGLGKASTRGDEVHLVPSAQGPLMEAVGSALAIRTDTGH